MQPYEKRADLLRRVREQQVEEACERAAKKGLPPLPLLDPPLLRVIKLKEEGK